MTIKEIQSIIKDFESSPLMTLELEMEGFKLKLSKIKTLKLIKLLHPKKNPMFLYKQHKNPYSSINKQSLNHHSLVLFTHLQHLMGNHLWKWDHTLKKAKSYALLKR